MIGLDAPKIRRKLEKLIEGVRYEMKVEYKLKKDIRSMTWDEKMDNLSPECWMIEQNMRMLEQHLKREDRKLAKF